MEPLYQTSTYLSQKETLRLFHRNFKETYFQPLRCIQYILLSIACFFSLNNYILPCVFIAYTIIKFSLIYLSERKECLSDCSTINISIIYTFFKKFFHVETPTTSYVCCYMDIDEIIETETNFYIVVNDTTHILAKENCSAALRKFLLSSKQLSLSKEEKQEILLYQQNKTDSETNFTPLCQTTTLITKEERKLLAKTLKQRPAYWKSTWLDMYIFSLIIGFLSQDIANIIKILVYITFFVILVEAKQHKKSSSAIPVQFLFYDTYVQAVTYSISTKYYYRHLYKILETDSRFYLMDDKDSALIILKANCSSEMIDFIRLIKKNHT